MTHVQQHKHSPFRGSVLSFQVKTGLGIAGGAMMGVFSLGGVSSVGDGVFWTSYGRIAPVCLAKKLIMSSFKIRPSFPVPTTSLSLI